MLYVPIVLDLAKGVWESLNERIGVVPYMIPTDCVRIMRFIESHTMHRNTMVI